MLFRFPGRTPLPLMVKPLQLLLNLLATEQLDEVSEMHVSLLGWRDGRRCQIRDQDNLISEIIFGRIHDEQGTPLDDWGVFPGWRICDRPDDLEWSPFSVAAREDD